MTLLIESGKIAPMKVDDKRVNDKKDYYGLLEATPNTTHTDLKRNYRMLALRHHPDMEQDPNQRRKQHERMQSLNEAYETLRDPDRRSRYDTYCGFQRCKVHPASFIYDRCSRCFGVVCPQCCRAPEGPRLCVACLERSERRRRTSDPVERALLALEDGEISLAQCDLDEALLINPRNVVALTALATVREKQGDCKGAVEMLLLALQIKPGNAFSHYRLGMLYQRLGDLEQAAASYSEALRLNPGNNKYRRAIADLESGSTGSPEPRFHPNDRVAHTVFGPGVVTEVTPVGVRVNFGESGLRWLDPERSPMVRRAH